MIDIAKRITDLFDHLDFKQRVNFINQDLYKVNPNIYYEKYDAGII